MVGHDKALPPGLSGRHASGARSKLPHGGLHHPDMSELLRNSAMHFGGDDATVARLKDGVRSHDHLNHLSQNDASRIAHSLVGARRHASPQSRDLYTTAIHHMGYRFDEHGHIHKVEKADFAAAMKNPAFQAHMAVENGIAGEHIVTSGAVRGVEVSRVRGVEVSSIQGVEANGSMIRGVIKAGNMAPGA
jgi:hypothetical protein